jgi:hypothetical protein
VPGSRTRLYGWLNSKDVPNLLEMVRDKADSVKMRAASKKRIALIPDVMDTTMLRCIKYVRVHALCACVRACFPV